MTTACLGDGIASASESGTFDGIIGDGVDLVALSVNDAMGDAIEGLRRFSIFGELSI